MTAACRDMDIGVFIHPERVRDLYATSLWERCPVLTECRRHALTVQEAYGVRGGLTIDERAAILSHPSRIDSARHA